MATPHLAAFARLTDSLARATSLPEVYDGVLDVLQDALGVTRASILLFDEKDFMGFVAWRGISDRYRAAVNGHTPWRPDSPKPEPFGVADVAADASLANYAEVFRAEGIRALAFFPLVYRDRVIGKFMLYYAEPHELTAEELELARTIAGQIAFGIARVSAELQLQRERNRLDALIASVPGVVWETLGESGPDRQVTFVSEQILELLGYSREEWLSNPRLRETVILEPPTVVSAGLPSVQHYRMRHKDGREIWAEVRAASKVEDGVVRTRGFTMEITDRKHADRRAAFLAEASKVLGASLDYDGTLDRVARLVVSELADWCSVDLRESDGSVRRVSVAHRDPAKAEAVARLRAHMPDRHHSNSVRSVLASGRPWLTARVPAEFLTDLERTAPELRRLVDDLGGLVSFMVVPLVAGGRTFGALSLVSSSEERIYSDSDLALGCELGLRAGYAVDHARLYKEAQEANRAKDEFLATLSHELRTPMTATLGWASMLKLTELSPDNVRVAIDTIERSTRAQAKLIDDLLDVSRIVSGKLQLQVAPVSLGAVIEAAVETIRPSITAKDIDLQLQLDPIDGALAGDAARLQQVIWNLLSNAVKFTPTGGSIAITLSQPDRSHVTVSVRDSGRGIAPNVLPHVFERFRQADSSSTRAHGGLGLGLAIVKNLVEMHGGSVSAASDGEGRGALFTIRLPLGTATVPRSVRDEPPVALALTGVSVLLVEDEADTRTMLAVALREFGADVTPVESAGAALEALAAAPAHVVISDIGMPGEDGYSLMMKIRAGSPVPSIALTAYARPEDRSRALASGFTAHLAKPVDPRAIVDVVRRVVGR